MNYLRHIKKGTLLLILVLFFMLISCQNPELKIKNDDKMFDLVVGDVRKVVPEIKNGIILEWESSNENIIEVDDDGVITAISVGEATVTVKIKGRNISQTINVNVIPVNIISVKINGVNQVEVNKSIQLTAAISPSNANQMVTWSTSDIKIATVSNAGLITGVAEGEVKITATAVDGTKDEIKIIVFIPTVTRIVIQGDTEIVLGTTSAYIAVIVPENDNKSIEWSVSDTSIAKINAAGILTPYNPGVITIKAKVVGSDIEGTLEVMIVRPAPTNVTIQGEKEVLIGNTVIYNAVVNPQYADQSITWSVSDTSIATIDSTTGELISKALGMVIVKATSVNGIEDEIEIIIRNDYEILENKVLRVLSKIPSQINNDYIFPNTPDHIITWSYHETTPNDDYFNLKTGVLRKVSIAPRLIRVIANVDGYTWEKVINFGIMENWDSTGRYYPANYNVAASSGAGQEPGTFDTQLSGAGFSGMYVVIDNVYYFLGKYSYIELNSADFEFIPGANDAYGWYNILRPYGIGNTGVQEGTCIYNDYYDSASLGLYGYSALYYNSGNTPLTFGDSFAYGRTYSGIGMTKAILRYDQASGKYKVISGSSALSVTTTITLQPGDYLLCNGTAERYSTGLTYKGYTTNATGISGILQDGVTLMDIKTFKATSELVEKGTEDVTSVEINGNAIVTLGTTELYTTSSIHALANQKVEWKVINGTGSATINAKGILSAISPGTVTIIATAANGIQGMLDVEIIYAEAESVEVNKVGDSNKISLGKPYLLTAIVNPVNANPEVYWEIAKGDENKAIINKITGEFIGLKAGMVTVIVYAKNGITNTFEIEITVTPDMITIVGETQVVLGETSTYLAIVTPDGANQAVIWSVSDESIATINANGLLNAIRVGSVIVRATAFGTEIYGLFEVTIVHAEDTDVEITGKSHIYLGDKETYHAIVYPLNANQKIVWSVSDETIATIDSNGILTGIASGKVTIMAVSVNGITRTIDVMITAYHEIRTIEDLIDMNNNLSYRYILMNDIDLTGEEWLPIGTKDNPFTGYFLGNGYSISNLTITSNENNYIGLFGYVNNAKFFDLELKNVCIAIKGTPEQTLYVGGLVGYAVGNIIVDNCEVSGNINVNTDIYNSKSGIYSGGLVGLCTDSLLIINSSNFTSIMAKSYLTSVGGLIGYGEMITIENSCNHEDITTISGAGSAIAAGLVGRGNPIKIINSYSIGDINATSNNGWVYAGGLIGSGSATINHSHNTGTITGTDGYVVFAGGLIGNSSTEIIITDSYNTGDVSASNNYSYAGGLIGGGNDISIIDSHNCGRIMASAYNNIAIAGGLVGRGFNTFSVKIKGSYNTGEITSETNAHESRSGGLIAYSETAVEITDSYNTGNVLAITNTNTPSAAGLIGYSYSKVIVINSYNTGDIMVEGNGTYLYIGGLIGFVNNYSSATIINSHNTGDVVTTAMSNTFTGGLIGVGYLTTITNSYNTGNITGYNCVGGLIGWTGNNTATINHSYNTGNITSHYFAGGLIGYSNTGSVIVNNSYNSGNIISTSISGGILGSSHNESMQSVKITLHNTYNSGNITATAEENFYVTFAGGLIGHVIDSISISSEISILNSYNIGNIKASGYTRNYAGGLVGSVSDLLYNTYGKYENCLSLGMISGMVSGVILGLDYTDSGFSNCYYYDISVSQTNNCLRTTLDDLNNELFYINVLGWDEDIWDLSDLDYVSGKLPILK